MLMNYVNVHSFCITRGPPHTTRAPSIAATESGVDA